MLNIISTPIGNIEDVTYRAIRILTETEYIICEDTRRIAKLLKHYDIPKKILITYNDFNKKRTIPKILEIAKENDIALVSDNGTPTISDPGYNIINECRQNKISITALPGPSAFLTALTLSGFATDKFTFIGFLPKTKGKKEKTLEEIKSKKQTIIAYESPHRILKTLEQINKIMPDKQICVARELTKKFEEVLIGKAHEVLDKEIKPKGEFVLLFNK